MNANYDEARNAYILSSQPLPEVSPEEEDRSYVSPEEYERIGGWQATGNLSGRW